MTTHSATGEAPDLDVWVEVETPEQIAFSYSVAGIGSRGAAAVIDVLICMGALITLFVTLYLLVVRGGSHTKEPVPASGAWLIAVLTIAQFVMVWGYYVLFEGIWDGQTPGKRIMKIRVVRDGGYSVTFAASAVRNLVRALDAQPFFLYLVGIVAAMLSSSRKRIGDIVAGTFVVKESRTEVRAASAPRLAARVTTRLTDDEYALLERFMSRRQTLDQERRHDLVARLAARFAAQLPNGGTVQPAAALVRLFEDERDARASGVASRSDTGARREQHAIVALGLKRWNDFSAALDAAYARGLSRMRSQEVSALVAQYREITTDLARLQTATRGRNTDAKFYLSRLVARGHNLLYRQRGMTLSQIATYMATTVPREVRRSWRPIGLAALLLFAPAAVSYTAVVRDPTVASKLLPDEMLSRANSGTARERKGQGYVTIPEEMMPVAASAIITNNVKVTYVSFVMGLTAGIGTVLLLVFNGVAIGSAVGLFASRRIAHLILAFVAPHGVLELSAICIAAGGGLLIAAAMLMPGNRTRREALIANGTRAMNLLAASTAFLLVAGSLEGLVSPRVWPMAWKLSISGATALLMIAYVSLGRRSAPVKPAG